MASSSTGIRVTIESIILVFTMLAAGGWWGGAGGGGHNWRTADAILCTTLM